MRNKVFWIVDLQKDFVNPDGALYVPEADMLKPKWKNLKEIAIYNKMMVISSKDTHTRLDKKEISDNPDFKTTFPPHCMIGTEGIGLIPEAQIYNRVLPVYKEHIDIKDLFNPVQLFIPKNTFDVFENNIQTDKIMTAIPEDVHFFVYGVALDFCVDYAIMGLLKNNRSVIVIVDACKAIDEGARRDFYKKWEKHGADLILTSEVEECLGY